MESASGAMAGSEQTRGGPLGVGGRAGDQITRRTLLARAARLGIAASTLGALDLLATVPARAQAARAALPEIQYAIERYIAPAVRSEGVRARFGPLYTTFATISLQRAPQRGDQEALARALARIEKSYPFAPRGVFLTLAYGLPYFERLPGGMSGALVAAHMPRLSAATDRYALEEAVPGPSDVSPQNPEVRKARFGVPVQIEANDMVLSLRSDSTQIIDDVLAWLMGESETLAGASVGDSGLAELLSITSRRLMFTQIGLPRKVAEEAGLPYAQTMNPQSPMWMGFVSQQVGSSGPPRITTFLGNWSSQLTTARHGDYFDLGSIMHLSHVIQDLEQFYEAPGETYVRRAGEMFSAAPPPSEGYADQFANGGGPAFVPNVFAGTRQAEYEASGMGTYDAQPHLAHTTALQRTSRSAAGTPIHIRADGPGFDALDVPDGSSQPKLQFSMFVPTADFFATMRASQASNDLAQRFGVPARNQGIERFLTATRRQNFLVPPRRHRALPLVELA